MHQPQTSPVNLKKYTPAEKTLAYCCWTRSTDTLSPQTSLGSPGAPASRLPDNRIKQRAPASTSYHHYLEVHNRGQDTGGLFLDWKSRHSLATDLLWLPRSARNSVTISHLLAVELPWIAWWVQLIDWKTRIGVLG